MHIESVPPIGDLYLFSFADHCRKNAYDMLVGYTVFFLLL